MFAMAPIIAMAVAGRSQKNRSLRLLPSPEAILFCGLILAYAAYNSANTKWGDGFQGMKFQPGPLSRFDCPATCLHFFPEACQEHPHQFAGCSGLRLMRDVLPRAPLRAARNLGLPVWTNPKSPRYGCQAPHQELAPAAARGDGAEDEAPK